jgi:cbb3-type cytochrome oxidase maturation protein
MEVMYMLIAFSLLIASGFLLAFMWAVRSGQFDDRYTPSVRMLIDDIRPGEKKAPVTGKQTGRKADSGREEAAKNDSGRRDAGIGNDRPVVAGTQAGRETDEMKLNNQQQTTGQ